MAVLPHEKQKLKSKGWHRFFVGDGADSRQAEIIKALDIQGINARQAEGLTGIAATDFSRIRHVKLDRFTIDRLLAILERLDMSIDVQVTVRPHARQQAAGYSAPSRTPFRAEVGRHSTVNADSVPR